jgi:hypothetical protein
MGQPSHPDEPPRHPDNPEALRVSVRFDTVSVQRASMSG